MDDHAAAALDHRRQGVLGHQECTFEAGVDRQIPLVFGAVRHRLRVVNAGVVEQDVDASVALQRLLDRALALVGEADVGDHEERLPAGFDDFSNDLQATLLTTPRDRDACALARQQDGGRLADPGAASGDQGGFASQLSRALARHRHRWLASPPVVSAPSIT